MNPFNLLKLAAGNNGKLLQTMHQAYQVAQGIQKTRQGILSYLEQNNAKIRDMLPHLNQGRPARVIMDRVLPGMADRVQTFGAELMKEQEQGQKGQTIDIQPIAYQEGGTTWNSEMGNRFPPLKQR